MKIRITRNPSDYTLQLAFTDLDDAAKATRRATIKPGAEVELTTEQAQILIDAEAAELI